MHFDADGFPQVVTYTAGVDAIKRFTDKNTKTGTPLERSFCSICGSPVAIQTALQPGRIFVPAGLLDDKALQDMVPMSENFVEERVGWMGQVAAKEMPGMQHHG